MKKALCDTTNSVQHIISWEGNNAIYETYPNSARVCEVTDTPFEVYPTLIWVDCADDVLADQYWYNKETKTINVIENESPPPITIGVQEV